MIFNPESIDLFRAVTERHAKTAGITSLKKICCVCKKQTTRAKRYSGTIGSRLDPVKWACIECFDKKKGVKNEI